MKCKTPAWAKPGDSWNCDDGTRHFICGGCEDLCTAPRGWSEAEGLMEAVENLGEIPEDNDRMSVCDECYPVLLQRAREAGLL